MTNTSVSPLPRVLFTPCVFSAAECESFIARADAHGFEFASVRTAQGQRAMPDVRNNSRTIIDDSALAESLWTRVAPLVAKLPQRALPVRLNPRFRFYRYEPGERFSQHRDGVELIDGLRSRLTLIVYLNDNFLGGETTFFETLREKGTKRTVEHPVFAERGAAVLFEHQVLHEGSELISGTKYVLRTDVLFDA